MKSELDLNNFIVIDNFLEKDKFEEIQKLESSYNEERGKYNINYLLQKDHWSESLFRADDVEAKDIFVQDKAYHYGLDNEKSILHLQNKIISYLSIKKEKNLYLQSQFYVWKNSNIFWHNDDSYDYGVTYYISKEWKKNWGGELLLENGQWISPKPNRIVFIKAPFSHKTCIVAEGAGERITIQTFVQKKFKPESLFSGERLKLFIEMLEKKSKIR